MHPFITVVLPTYDRFQELKATIACLQRQTFEDFDIVVVDDTPRTCMSYESIREYCSEITGLTYVHRDLSGYSDRPVASARGCGAAMALGEIVLWLDQDFLLCENFLTNVAKVHRHLSDCIVVPNIVMSNLTIRDIQNTPASDIEQFFSHVKCDGYTSYWGTSSDFVVTYKVTGAPGCSMRRSTFMRYDLWDVHFPGYAVEDVDFAASCMRAQIPCVHIMDAMGIHLHHSTDRYTVDMWQQARNAFYNKWGYYPPNPIDPFQSREEISKLPSSSKDLST